MTARVAFALLVTVSLAPIASAEKWLKIDPNDPFSDDGLFHQFDVDSAFEDNATGFVAATMIYVKPAEAVVGVVTSRHLWAFDCVGNNVHYVAVTSQAEGTQITANWLSQPHSLSEPVMGNVTNMFGRKLCALRGSWPKADLPK